MNTSVVEANRPEGIACVICAYANLTTFARLQEFDLLRCPKCNTLIKFSTRNDSRPEGQSVADMDYLINGYEAIYRPFRMRTYERVIKVINPLVVKNAACLDIGCASGWFLDIASRYGWKCFGIDASQVAIQKAKLNVSSGRFKVELFSNDTFTGLRFELVSLLDVLEHISNPLETLRVVYKKLSPKGVIAIRVPVIDSMMLWASKCVYDVSGGRFKKPLNLLYQYHRTGFSSSSLFYGLEHCGFQILDCWRENSLDFQLLAGKSWAKSGVERFLASLILLIQMLQDRGDEIVVVARKRSS